uniref:Methyltransferase n=2 Tax=Kalanchoe fedtschenkoi TaxID=63787 RepID=A0A7N0UC33_KALFE
MSKPLHRGVRTSWGGADPWDSPTKDVSDREDSRATASPLKFDQTRIQLPDDNAYSSRNSLGGENGHINDKYAGKNLRAKHKLALLIIKMSLVVIVIVALTGSFWWALSISTSSSKRVVLQGYKHLQHQLVADLRDIGEISLGFARFKELELCPPDFDNHVPCFNVSENLSLGLAGLHSKVIAADSLKWNSDVRNYWSLLSPQIFSDHPKRPGDEDPSPPYNMLRNVLDMNAHFGGFNAALLEAGKSVWVMNVVPTTGANHLPLIFDRGFVGVLHDWCEAFPTYPRTYDMVHAEGLLSLEIGQRKCSQLDLFTEIDRILRPEGWIIFRDTSSIIESARALSTRLKWDSRIVEIDSNNEEKLLICQKPFLRRQAS